MAPLQARYVHCNKAAIIFWPLTFQLWRDYVRTAILPVNSNGGAVLHHCCKCQLLLHSLPRWLDNNDFYFLRKTYMQMLTDPHTHPEMHTASVTFGEKHFG